jgi:hemerythrin-like metal-binding protein
MPFLEWNDDYNIGVKEIDNQHRGLFDIISKLFTTRQYEPDGKYYFLTLNKLIEYARVHFATEERYMREAGYAKLAEHKQEHIQFLSEVMKLSQSLEKKEPAIENKILDYLKSWYMTHILGTDRDYQQALRAKGFM